MSEDRWGQLQYLAGQVFTPGSPISDLELFSGRLEQVQKIVEAITQKGYHAILYGERGVGKTSLSNVLPSFVESAGDHFLLPRVNCDASDTFTSLWKKQLRDIAFAETRRGVGFQSNDVEVNRSIVDGLPKTLTPDIIRQTLAHLSNQVILVAIFDEFDRVVNTNISTLMADTIKGLSDYGIKATIVLIGVADSVDELIKEHQSIERVFVQVPMPRMSNNEVKDIVEKGLAKLKMTMERSEASTIVSLSQGLPYVTHLLSLHATRSALRRQSVRVLEEDLGLGIMRSLENWQQSIKTTYYTATISQQPGSIFRQVLLACAFAKNDDFGYFSAANVRSPLRIIIPEKEYDIPNFARHLKQFSGPERGELLDRTGGKRRLRYRFNNPLMRPYIIMRALHDGIIESEQFRTLQKFDQPSLV